MVELEHALAPDVEVLDIARSYDRLRPGADVSREQTRDDVDLVAGRARDEEVGPAGAVLDERRTACAVSFDRAYVEVVGERIQPAPVEVDDGKLVLRVLVERLDDRRADLTGSDDEDL